MKRYYYINVHLRDLLDDTEAILELSDNTVVSVIDISEERNKDKWEIDINSLVNKSLEDALDTIDKCYSEIYNRFSIDGAEISEYIFKQIMDERSDDKIIEKAYIFSIKESNTISHTHLFVVTENNKVKIVKDISFEKKYEWDGWKVNLESLLNKSISEVENILNASIKEKEYKFEKPYISCLEL
jgi:hypothetical protein